MSPKLRFFLAALAIVLVLDQPAKILVDLQIPLHDRLPILDGALYLTHARNPGAAFGLFDQAPDARRLVLFALVSLLATAIVLSFYRRLAPGDRRNACALGLILGGTVGNLVDRMWRGEVIDFLHVQVWKGYVWPDFNFSDVAIVVGVGSLVLELLASEAAVRGGDGAAPRSP